jgi:hypothetical protein
MNLDKHGQIESIWGEKVILYMNEAPVVVRIVNHTTLCNVASFRVNCSKNECLASTVGTQILSGRDSSGMENRTI